MFFVRQILKQMLGSKADEIPGLAITDNQDLFSCVHNLKPCEDKRLLADVISIKQAIIDDKTITELRYVPKEEMIADCLTKTRKAKSLEMISEQNRSLPDPWRRPHQRLHQDECQDLAAAHEC